MSPPRRAVCPRVLIEPSVASIVVEVRTDWAVVEKGELVIDDGAGGVEHAVCIAVGGVRVRYLLDGVQTGLVDLTVMVVAETGHLFLGGKRRSCVVDLERGVVEHVFEHCLFWGFDRATRPGFVLETGELDCLFRGLDGEVLAQTRVDPPWECHVEAEGVRFESSGLGTTFLAFPDRDA